MKISFIIGIVIICCMGILYFTLSCKVVAQGQPFSLKELQDIELFDLVEPSYFKASDGTNLAYYPFIKNNNQAVVILYCGAGLYGNQSYQWVAKTLQKKYNIGCYIFDLRGHGHSQGDRGDASTIERVLLDVQQAVDFVKEQHADVPFYLAGHSSGAGLIINYAANMKNKLEDGYIFIAPYFGPQSDTAQKYTGDYSSFVKFVRVWVYILGMLFPKSFIIHYPAVFFNYSDELLAVDPLIVPFYSYTMSCATSPYDIVPLLEKLDKPVGLFIGEQDEQFMPEKVMAYRKYIHACVQSKIIKDAGHLSILLQVPKLIASFIGQLKKVEIL